MLDLKSFLGSPEALALADQKWRLNNLYRIVTRDGDSIKFKLNSVQESVYDNLHNRNLVLKARQLGMSTFAVLYLLDSALFTPSLACGIVSYSLEHAQHVFRRIIGHAVDTLPPWLSIVTSVTQRSAREITFANGAFLRVDTTLRGGSYQLVLVSEFGKTCARNPVKAEEVMTGTLNSLSQSSTCIIESTGEGNEGYFAEMCTTASQCKDTTLSPLQYKLHFFPWYLEPSYTTTYPVTQDTSMDDYFSKVEKDSGVKLTLGQRAWYTHTLSTQGDKMRQEFPSTISEAFLSSSDAYYFAQCIEQAHTSSRCLYTPLYDALEHVYVAMDIGVNDLTVIIFFQVVHCEIRVFDYYEDKNKGVDFYCRLLLQDKKLSYHTIFLPHDAAHRDGIVVENTYERDFRRLFSGTSTKFMVLPRTDKNINISNAKLKFGRCVFAMTRVKPLVDQLGKYRKKWSEQYGKYLDEPYHDISSNYADAFQYLCQGITHIEAVGGNKGAIERHKAAVDNRRFRL